MIEPIFTKNDDFLKVPKLRTSIQRIVLNHSRPWKPSRKLVRTVLTPKILDIELQTRWLTSRSTARTKFISDMKSTYLEVSGTTMTKSPDDFFRVQKSRKQGPCHILCAPPPFRPSGQLDPNPRGECFAPCGRPPPGFALRAS